MRYRLAIRFAIEGDLRFISHHDSLRLFERALARAETPVRFSEGFNPRPRMRLALPRPVGVASLDELLVVELSQDSEAQAIFESLRRQMPEGLALLGVERLSDHDERRPNEATYELPIDPQMVEPLTRRAADLLAMDHLWVTRKTPRSIRAKSVDIRAFLTRMLVADDRLTWTQTVSQDGTVRIGELLEALGLTSEEHLHRVTRRSVAYQR
ncbi:MAG TPA: TIGR03936 family radical SAM-associated protein [Phycisphaerae bacterium]|nr:TIGR03936 family radical SAM-associated protein [Phycisphaerae bacterium]